MPCEICNHESTQKHRLLPGEFGGTYAPENVVELCPNHHTAVHFLMKHVGLLPAGKALRAADQKRFDAYRADAALWAFWGTRVEPVCTQIRAQGLNEGKAARPSSAARKARLEAGLSRTTAAKRLDIAPETLTALETQRHPWGEDTAKAAAKLYGCKRSVFTERETAKKAAAKKPRRKGPLLAREAREAAGLTVQEAAKRARVSASYLLERERTSDFPLVLAQRLAFIYQTDLRAFIPHPSTEQQNAAGGAKRGRQGRRTPASHRGKGTRAKSGIAHAL
jgi:transcriptional regulator with XRE-family HTH domain